LAGIVRGARDGGRLIGVRDVGVEFAVQRDGASIAYEVFGNGPIDLVLAMGRFPIDLMWELPQLAEFLDRLGEMARVIAYDARGSGASDPMPTDPVSQVEMFAGDCLAVLDAVGCDRATFLGLYAGASGVFFAATYPERMRSLIVSHLRPSFPELRGLSIEQRRKMARALSTTRGLRSDNPRVAHDPVLQRWWGRARRATSPDAIARQMEWAAKVDIEPVLGTVRTPTLVLHRRENPLWDVETSRTAATLIPNARFVEVPGAELDMFLGDSGPVLAEIERFLSEPDAGVALDRVLATVLFTDLVSSTPQLAEMGDRRWRDLIATHDALVRTELDRYRGQEVRFDGDGVLATFDGPGRAVRCACAIRDAIGALGLDVRAGLHTGEIELRGDGIEGIAVVVGKRVSSTAGSGEVLVSRTVADLIAGSGIELLDKGEHELKGVPGTWRLFSVQD
jgi:class 3 adenylate cyclase